MDDNKQIENIVTAYFQGLHQGDAKLLMTLFHPDCVLKAPGLRRELANWLEDVQLRPIPQQQGHLWSYQILTLEIEGEQAMVKVRCPLPHGDFVDYLGLLKENQQWLIVNKMYANHKAG